MVSDELAVAGLLFAIVGPWACGAVWLHWWLAWSGRLNVYVLLGHGYLLGMLLVGVVIRLWDTYSGLPLQFWPMAGIIVVLTTLGIALHWLRQANVPLQRHWEPLPRWHLAVIALVMIAIVVRHATLLQMLLLQPDFSVEAWSKWSMRPLGWFYSGALDASVAVSPAAAELSVNEHFAGAADTVPLIQLWGMLSIGAADHAFVFLPWMAVPVALGFAVFGHLRLAGAKTLQAAIACYALLSLPVLNEHTALAGYADIWLAAVFTLGICAVHQWRITRHWAYGSLALVLAFGCAMVKNAGVMLGYILLVALVVGAFRAAGWVRLVLLAVALVMIVVPVVTLAMAATGAIDPFTRSLFDTPAVWFADSAPALARDLFAALLHDRHWYLLWYAALMIVGVGVLRGRWRRLFQAQWLAVLGGFLWMIVHWKVVGNGSAAAGADAINAALLVAAPGMVFCLGLFGTAQLPQR